MIPFLSATEHLLCDSPVSPIIFILQMKKVLIVGMEQGLEPWNPGYNTNIRLVFLDQKTVLSSLLLLAHFFPVPYQYAPLDATRQHSYPPGRQIQMPLLSPP